MAAKIPFPLFSPQLHPTTTLRPPTEIHFSRWNNANARKFNRHEQKELEDQRRFEKRFDSALSIAHNYNPAPPHPTTFKSAGTPSAPSSPSLPGKFSKYSRSPPSEGTQHPAFKSRGKIRTRVIETRTQDQNPAVGLNFRVDENGVSYEVPEAPFLYQYSYTETPKVKPLKLREPLVSPFGPGTMAKPWLGRKPLPPSKKKLAEFDSFRLPPPHKKGVKPVQAPGPFLPGSGPKHVRSREEVLGEPLTKEEIEELISGSKKSNRQLNIGRDGLTHNMLDNIHSLWKRRRVCKIKCKGVCTVDMDNVCQQLEEKSGGKIIYNRGGVIYLFRGRNYNYKSRPRYPLMLWKPVTPVYPRLAPAVPEGLTLEEARDMRKKGRDLIPICKLAKNGVYCDLVKNVREAFEACELVRINCQGLHVSDYKKIGAKLKDLVPCVLLSFEFEHILMWRGRDWKSTMEPIEDLKILKEVKADDVVASELLASPPSPSIPSSSGIEAKPSVLSPTYSIEESHGDNESSKVEVDGFWNGDNIDECEKSPVFPGDHLEVSNQTVESNATYNNEESQGDNESNEVEVDGFLNGDNVDECEKPPVFPGDDHSEVSNQTVESHATLENTVLNCENEQEKISTRCTEGILLLREQAVESGMALVLDNRSLDADTVFKESVAFAETAPAGPSFPTRQWQRKQLAAVDENKEQESDGSEDEVTVSVWTNERKTPRDELMKEIKADYLNVVPQGNLGVDELAKLLA